MLKNIKNSIEKSIAVKHEILLTPSILISIEKSIRVIVESYMSGKKTLFCGNGGSAADAQHLAAELSGRFYYDRPPLHSEALHVNTSYLTAVANDYSFDEIYARYVKAAGQKGDVFIGLSTSGNSKNVINAFIAAKKLKMTTIAFTGKNGGEMINLTDILINVPSTDTPRIQEAHILIGHIICELVEARMFSKS